MPEPVQISPTTASRSPVAPTSTAEENSATKISSDFETFLLMLTTQLENQDPLNPIESQDFAVQLATFSGVEQQVQTNDLLRDLGQSLGASGLSQLAEWVGVDARVSAPIEFIGAPVDIFLDPESNADTAELIVTNSSGQVVTREQVPTETQSISWAGTGADGSPLPQGTYTLSLASVREGEVSSTRSVSHYARINEARQGDNGSVELVTDGGTIVPAESVSALREPAS